MTLSIGCNLGFIGEAIAENQRSQRCRGAACNDKDPVEYGCEADAQVVEEVTHTVFRWQDGWQPRQIIIKQIYSASCRANWTKAYVPSDTFLFVKERSQVNRDENINGLFKSEGDGYFWTYGNMANGEATNQSCVALQSFEIPGLGYWYDRYCTGFN